MKAMSMVAALFFTVVFLLSANGVSADTFNFPAPQYKGTVFVVVIPDKSGSSSIKVSTAWGDWEYGENITMTTLKKGIVIMLNNNGSKTPTTLKVTATNGIVTKIVQKERGQVIEEWNSPLYICKKW